MSIATASPRRTDVHRPSALITEDYEFAYAYDAHPEDGDRGACVHIVNALVNDGWRFGQVHGGDTCDHCGARLRYVAVLKHLPTRTLIKVGEQCLDNRFELATPEFHRLRKAAALKRERTSLKAKRAAWLAEDADRQTALDFCEAKVSEGDYGFEGMRFNFVHKVNRYGDTSDKFVAAILRDKTRTEEREARLAAERADASPVVTGKGVRITGEIISMKLHENSYGTREVMTVKDERGFKVWGTQPRSLYEAQVGDKVTFLATVEVSDRDESFGFFRRPTRAQIAC